MESIHRVVVGFVIDVKRWKTVLSKLFSFSKTISSANKANIPTAAANKTSVIMTRMDIRPAFVLVTGLAFIIHQQSLDYGYWVF